MNRSSADPRPVPRPVAVGRYRYTKWRWRISVGLLDAVGSVLMLLWRVFRPARSVLSPRKILVVQLDHMGDAILSTPIFPRLRAAYPDASIEVLASPSNREVFEGEPEVDRVHLADRNWFERRPGRRALGSAVWTLGRSLRTRGYDLGIDVRGDILTVFVLALAGIPRRLGWSMGGGGFLLTDVARWVPGRHEVESRRALLDCLVLPDETDTRVRVHATDRDRTRLASMLREAWPGRTVRPVALVGVRLGNVRPRRPSRRDEVESWDEPDALHAGRFGDRSPLLAVHLGAGALAKRWPTQHWTDLIARFLGDGWRVILVGGFDDVAVASVMEPHPRLRDWTGRLAVTETAALLERADLFIGSDSGPAHIAASASTASVILFSGDKSPETMAALVAAGLGPPPSSRVSSLPSQNLPAGRPSVHDRPDPRPGLPGPRGDGGAGSTARNRPMSRSELKTGAIDWQAWLALAWAAWFGLLYTRMVLDERAPRSRPSDRAGSGLDQNMV